MKELLLRDACAALFEGVGLSSYFENELELRWGALRDSHTPNLEDLNCEQESKS